MGVRDRGVRSGHPCEGEEVVSAWDCRVSATMCWVLETLPACLSSTRTHGQTGFHRVAGTLLAMVTAT